MQKCAFLFKYIQSILLDDLLLKVEQDNIFILVLNTLKIAEWQFKINKNSDQLPRWKLGKEFARQYRRCKRHRCDSWVGQIPWNRNGNPLQYSLENSVDRGAWQARVHGLRQTRLSKYMRISAYITLPQFQLSQLNLW